MDTPISWERQPGLRAGIKDVHLRGGEVGMGGTRPLSFFYGPFLSSTYFPLFIYQEAETSPSI